MKLNAIIVDDEPLARKRIERLLECVAEIKIVGIYGTGKEAIAEINKLQPHILFLDIKLKDVDGFYVLEHITVKMPLTIFVTAFDTYAIEAFDFYAFDYLLKPITEERFYKSIFRVIETLKNISSKDFDDKVVHLLKHVKVEQQQELTSFSSRIPIAYANKTVFVNKEDIHYILASNYYIEIYTANRKYVQRNSMYCVLKELNSELFLRIHRSSIINLDYIDELQSSAYGEIDVKMRDGKQLRVSKGYRKQFALKVGLRK